MIAKADCYGAGSVCAKLLATHVDYYGVARAMEGVRLRNKGILAPIIVLSHSREQLYIEKKYRLIPAVGTSEDLILADNYGIPEVHICIDTGMNRNGFKNELSDQIQTDKVNDNSTEFANFKLERALKSVKNVQISGVFSHIYHDSRFNAVNQSRRFEKAVNFVSDILGRMPMRHLWASGGISFINDYSLPHYEMVRLGLKAYDEANYVISNILSVKKIHRGETVGYEAAFTAPQDMIIAIIEGGYADGILRVIRNGLVIIKGCKAKIVGYISMDVFMADVTGIDCAAGDIVILLDNDMITLDDIAASTNTCKYEVLTRMKGRYKYVYLI